MKFKEYLNHEDDCLNEEDLGKFYQQVHGELFQFLKNMDKYDRMMRKVNPELHKKFFGFVDGLNKIRRDELTDLRSGT